MSTVDPRHVQAICTAAELLAAIDPFEQIGCAFASASVAQIRTLRKDPHSETFEFRGATFEMAPFWRVLLILGHAAKPTGPGGTNTLRPFAELIVAHSIQKVRLISPNPFVAWLEVSIQEGRWRKLAREGSPPAREPPPTTVIEPRIPAPRPNLEVDL